MLRSIHRIDRFHFIKIPCVSKLQFIFIEQWISERQTAGYSQVFIYRYNAAVTEQVTQEIIFRINKFDPVQVIGPGNMRKQRQAETK